MRTIEELLIAVQEQSVKGHPNFYKRFPDEERQVLHDHWELTCPEVFFGRVDRPLYNATGTQISVGWNRVVIGDYGAYLEIRPEQMCLENIRSKFSGTPKRPIAYTWMETKDFAKTKIYLQHRGVSYAAYRAGMYYVAPQDVRVGTDITLPLDQVPKELVKTVTIKSSLKGSEPCENQDVPSGVII